MSWLPFRSGGIKQKYRSDSNIVHLKTFKSKKLKKKKTKFKNKKTMDNVKRKYLEVFYPKII